MPTLGESKPPSGSQRILIIDDDNDDVCLFHRILENAGYLVSSALSGKEGLRAIREGQFELVVLDLAIPDLDGFDILRAIRDQVKKPRIIAVSGFVRSGILDAARVCGADLVLDKLVAMESLAGMVRTLLKP